MNDHLSVSTPCAGTESMASASRPRVARFNLKPSTRSGVRDGQITEHWGVANLFSLMQQLGATPHRAPRTRMNPTTQLFSTPASVLLQPVDSRSGLRRFLWARDSLSSADCYPWATPRWRTARSQSL